MIILVPIVIMIFIIVLIPTLFGYELVHVITFYFSLALGFLTLSPELDGDSFRSYIACFFIIIFITIIPINFLGREITLPKTESLTIVDGFEKKIDLGEDNNGLCFGEAIITPDERINLSWALVKKDSIFLLKNNDLTDSLNINSKFYIEYTEPVKHKECDKILKGYVWTYYDEHNQDPIKNIKRAHSDYHKNNYTNYLLLLPLGLIIILRKKYFLIRSMVIIAILTCLEIIRYMSI